MNRQRLGRVTTLLTTAAAASMLLGALILPGAAIAADTRILWIGAPDLTLDSTPADGIPDNNGKLFPTPVTVPAPLPAPQHLTLFDVQILNGDNQNLANTVLVISIPERAGLSINSIFDPNGGTDVDACDIAGAVITCDYGSLGAGAHRTVSVLVNVTSSYVATGQPQPLFTAQATTNNENGANKQTFMAGSGTFAVGAFSDNGLTTFVPEGTAQLATTGTGAGGNLSTKINFTAGAREVVQITEGASTVLLYPCPVGRTCQDDFSEVVTASAEFEDSPFFTWTLSARVPKAYVLSQGFVAHYATGATTPDWTLLFKTKSSFCGTDIAAKIAAVGQCIKSVNLSKPVGGVANLEIVVVMDHQGGMKY